jgi:hypothetical protein
MCLLSSFFKIKLTQIGRSHVQDPAQLSPRSAETACLSLLLAGVLSEFPRYFSNPTGRHFVPCRVLCAIVLGKTLCTLLPKGREERVSRSQSGIHHSM